MSSAIDLAPAGLSSIGLSPIGLSIDTTFDDTSVAVLSGHRHILSHATRSQIAAHAEFGGVVPERASRCHLEAIHAMLERAMGDAAALSFSDHRSECTAHPTAPPDADRAHPTSTQGGDGAATLPTPPDINWKMLDYVAVSNLPGLRGSILVGLVVAKSIALRQDIPLIGINHIHAHPYANWLNAGPWPFPALHLVVAGGHTVLLHQHDHFSWTLVGRSVDDAAGECLDKVAKLWGYPMPGGKAVDTLAAQHRPGRYSFPRPMWHSGDWNFSFSGLKTALANFRAQNPDAEAGPVLSAFFESVADVLIHKTLSAAEALQPRVLTLSGGVAASRQLCQRFQEACDKKGLRLYYPPPALCTDNAAMVACLASYHHAAQRHDALSLGAKANLPI